MTKQEISQAVARINELQAERAVMQFEYLNVAEEMKGRGMYGQIPQRIVDEAEHKGYSLKLWDDENGEELKQLKAKYGKYLGKVVLDEKM